MEIKNSKGSFFKINAGFVIAVAIGIVVVAGVFNGHFAEVINCIPSVAVAAVGTNVKNMIKPSAK